MSIEGIIDWIMSTCPELVTKDSKLDKIQWARDLVEREGIAAWKWGHGWRAVHPEDSSLLSGYYVPSTGTLDVRGSDGYSGPTPLHAALRAYTAVRLGRAGE